MPQGRTATAHAPPLRTTFHLSAAETRLALRLLGGESLRAAAEALDIGYESARGQLKSVFRKTGTHRQGELIALLARTPGWLDRHDVLQPVAVSKEP
jgi:DNA-binding CsgD family transcriptional regulator